MFYRPCGGQYSGVGEGDAYSSNLQEYSGKGNRQEKLFTNDMMLKFSTLINVVYKFQEQTLIVIFSQYTMEKKY